MPVKSAGKGFRALLDRMRERLHRHPREGGANAEHPNAPAPAAPAAASAKVVEPEILPPEAVASANGVAVAAPHADGAHDEPHKAVEEAQAEAPAQPEPGPHKPEPS
jgi:hypothetical protein